MQAEVQGLSRRDRLRAATSQEIIQVARQLLVTEGSAAMSLRAIAREMGMTAPALYRYYPSLEDLARHVVADIFSELSAAIEAAIAADGAGSAAGSAPATAAALITACRAFRTWATGHQAEFGLIFGSPLPGAAGPDDPLAECGITFGGIYLRLVTQLWRITGFGVPADDELAEALRPQLARYRDRLLSDLPLGVLQVFLRCWVLLYGTVSLEVFGHLKFALEDSEPMFDLMLSDLASMVGLTYPLP
ncbi:MAG TPA: TetR/AcrR family transcriptional regulator [Streptosporangiaceae bacterium]